MNKMGNKVINLIDKAVQAKYSLPAWLWVLVSFLTGVLIVFVAITDPVANAAFLSGLPFGGLLMGPLLALGALVAIVGMAKDRPVLVRYASFASFCFWFFTSFGFYASGGVVNILILPIWMLAFWAYKYLASFVRERDGV